jgi:hypothetical protein
VKASSAPVRAAAFKNLGARGRFCTGSPPPTARAGSRTDGRPSRVRDCVRSARAAHTPCRDRAATTAGAVARMAALLVYDARFWFRRARAPGADRRDRGARGAIVTVIGRHLRRTTCGHSADLAGDRATRGVRTSWVGYTEVPAHCHRGTARSSPSSKCNAAPPHGGSVIPMVSGRTVAPRFVHFAARATIVAVEAPIGRCGLHSAAASPGRRAGTPRLDHGRPQCGTVSPGSPGPWLRAAVRDVFVAVRRRRRRSGDAASLPPTIASWPARPAGLPLAGLARDRAAMRPDQRPRARSCSSTPRAPPNPSAYRRIVGRDVASRARPEAASGPVPALPTIETGFMDDATPSPSSATVRAVHSSDTSLEPRNGSPTSWCRESRGRDFSARRSVDPREVDPIPRSAALAREPPDRGNLPYYTSTITSLFRQRRRMGVWVPELDRGRGAGIRLVLATT